MDFEWKRGYSPTKIMPNLYVFNISRHYIVWNHQIKLSIPAYYYYLAYIFEGNTNYQMA